MSDSAAEVMIRLGRASDLPALAAIEASGAETFERFGQPLVDGSPPTPPEQWAAALDAGLLWIAEHPDDGPIGFLSGELADGGLYISEVDVMIAHQRRGHGRRLLQAAIDWAHRRGLADVTLTTFRSIPWNAPLYATMGFTTLDAAQTPPKLAATLADEAARGFTDRCGMRLAL
jgi:GNAT superfamily N-acetyltransferase